MKDKKLILFDCDGTLWEARDGDYISSISSGFQRIDSSTIMRIEDKKIFVLRKSVVPTIKYLFDRGWKIGIVSDNRSEPVIEALKLFGLWKYLDKKAINIRLWKGPCPKEIMVLEILRRDSIREITRINTILVDDRDYHEEMVAIGANFVNADDVCSLGNIH